ncbi:O-antigen ligase [Flavobacterium limicola]|uniref:O-antigen ligase n=1 Tax=Flavobacterium limicola TaxID=180441 RepID=A0A495S3E5_9FLAO|nr:O-antigen ligase family protein [Flavobacterium limicola]RKS94181.1 O-antigen ligase [Flavobacterium limicola]
MKQQINASINLNSEVVSQNNVYYDFMSLLFFACYLLMDFLPDFKSIEIIGTQYFYISILNLIIALFIFKNPSFLNQSFILILKKSHLLKIYILFLLLSGISFFSTKNISLTVVSYIEILVVFIMFLNLFAILYNRLHLIFRISIIIGISVILQTVIELSDILKDSGFVINALANLKGNTGNVNIFAASLNIKIPFLLIGAIYYSNWKKWFLISSLFLATFTIFLISARAAYLGLFFEIILFIIFYLKLYSIKKETVLNVVYLLIPMLLAFLLANILFSFNKGSGRYESVGSRVVQIVNTNEASVSARLTYWDNALNIINKFPVTGVGLGNWKIESIPYEKTTIDEAYVSSHAHNDFLEIAAETGIFNGLVYLSLFIIVFFINMKTILNKSDSNNKIIALLALLILTGYFIDAFFNFPLYRPTMQLGFVLVLALTIANTIKIDGMVSTRESSGFSVGIIIICLITIYITFLTLKAYQLEYAIKYNKKEGQTSDDILRNLPQLPNVGIYSEPFYEHLAIAYFSEEKYENAKKYFYLSNKINPYLGVSNWYLHKIEKINGNFDTAYEYIKTAFYSRPRTTNFYLDALRMASIKKDTSEIFKIHELFTKYRSMPSNWKNTASALSISKYDNNKIIAFVNKGLKIYPIDTTLLNRKTRLIKRKESTSINNIFIDGLPAESAAKINYMLEAKKMGDAQQFEKAIVLYNKAFKENPEKVVILQDIAVCYYRLDNPQIAINYLKKIENNPSLNDGKTEYLLSGCYFKIKDKTNGCNYLNIAFNKKYPNTEQLLNQLCK